MIRKKCIICILNKFKRQTPVKAQLAECCALAEICICVHALPAKPINATHGHRVNHQGLMLCSPVPNILFGRKIHLRCKTSLFATAAITQHQHISLVLYLLFGKNKTKNMKCNVGDSHILAGAGETPLVNTQRMKEDECTLQGQRKRLNNWKPRSR